MTNKEIDLLPCPFCGSEPSYRERFDEDLATHNQVVWKTVSCPEDCAYISIPDGYESGTAIEQWNTRSTSAQVEVKPLEWDVDGRNVRLDDSLMMGKGYDWDGWEIMRQEAAGSGGKYAIWPDTISSDIFSLYSTFDGLYCQNLTEDEAKAKAQADYERRILSALREGGDAP